MARQGRGDRGRGSVRKYVTDAEGRPIARGLVNFDAAELPAMMGRKSAWLAGAMGVQYEREVVHRDSLVLLDRIR